MSGEGPETVEDALWIDTVDLTDAPTWMSASEALRWVEGFMACRDRHKQKIAVLLDPDTVLDGPLVVLHPGQHVVERRQEVKPGKHTLTEGTFWTPWVVVASGPEVTG